MCSWPTCNPKSASLLGKIVESPNGGWRVTKDPAATPDAALELSESGGFAVDPSLAGGGVVELQAEGPALGVLDPARAELLASDYSPLLEPEWSDC